MPLARSLEKSSAVLLVIDIQNDFCSLNGNMAKIGRNMEPIQRMMPNLRRLIDACRSAGMRIIFTRMAHSAWTDSPPWVAKLHSNNARKGSWGADFVNGFEPHEEEWVVEKHRYSAFIGTDLDTVLRASGIDTVIVTGVNSDQCVDATAKHAFQLDYNVLLVRDCIATDSEALTQAILTMAEKSYAWLVTSDEIIENMSQETNDFPLSR